MLTTAVIQNMPTLLNLKVQIEKHKQDLAALAVKQGINEKWASLFEQPVEDDDDEDSDNEEEYDCHVRKRVVKKIGKGIVHKHCNRKHIRDYRDKYRAKASRARKKIKRSHPSHYFTVINEELAREWIMDIYREFFD
jgi:hypothetical protein